MILIKHRGRGQGVFGSEMPYKDTEINKNFKCTFIQI